MSKAKAKAKTETETTLTFLQESFVRAYLGAANGNATLACRMAGYKGADCTLGRRGYELIRNSKIRQAIDAQRARTEANTDLDVDKWRQMALDGLARARNKGDSASEATFLRMLGQHVGVFEEDNRQRGDKIGIVLR